MICQKAFSIQVSAAGGGCNGLPRLPEDGTWSEIFLTPGSTYTFDGAAGAASLVSTTVAPSGARETNVCNSAAAYTYTVDLDYVISDPPFTFPPIFEPRMQLTLTIGGIVVDTDTSGILGDGSMGTLSVTGNVPGDSVSRAIRVTIAWNAVPVANPPGTTSTCTLTGTVT